MVGIMRDITEQKRTEEAHTRAQAAYFAEAQRLSATGSFAWNALSGEIFWSDETCRILGYDPAIAPSIEAVIQRVHPDDLAVVEGVIERAAKEKREFDFEHRLVMPDGSVVLVLDPAGLGAALGLPKSDGARVTPQLEAWTPPSPAKVILFRDGATAIKALPLSPVARIQTITAGDIEIADGSAVLRIQGRLVPILRVCHEPLPSSPYRSLAVLLLQEANEVVGLAVDEIIDIVDEDMNVEISGRGDGVLGIATIRGETVEVLDAFYYIDAVRQNRRPGPSAQRRVKILIADGSGFYREMLGGMLREAGHVVDVAGSVAETLAILTRAQGYDALLVDLELACKADGEFARQINIASPKVKPLLIGMDDRGDEAARTRARAAGLADAVGRFDRTALRNALLRASAEITIDGVAA